MTKPSEPNAHRIDRDVSWLSFNERVLQEAEDPSLPLYDRLGFLAIVSSNLDEFFRVRVSAIRTLLRLKKKIRRGVITQPRRLLREIQRRVHLKQERLGHVFRSQIIPGLAEHGVFLVDESRVPPDLIGELLKTFEEDLREHLSFTELTPGAQGPFLENRALYLVTELHTEEGAPRWGLTKLPDAVPRFHTVSKEGQHWVLFVDDVVRLGLPFLFPNHTVGRSFSIKLSRDADLDLEDEFSGDLVAKIEKAISKRDQGVPTRLLYDKAAPYDLVRNLRTTFELEEEDLVPGGRYHNLHDLHSFPNPGIPGARRAPLPPLPHPVLTSAPSVLDAVLERDHLLHPPYQDVEPLLRFVEEAAAAEDVSRIHATLYRVADDSRIVEGLIRAANRGAQVTAFVEVKARFDEAHNLACASRMEEAGVTILYSMPGLKVHAKLIFVERSKDGKPQRFAYVGTGNLNEATSRIYADHGLFTSSPDITKDVRDVFRVLAKAGEQGAPPTAEDFPAFRKLLVAPHGLRSGLVEHIAAEVERAGRGEDARMIIKVNALEDPDMVDRLTKASQDGVHVRMIVRGICCLVPGVEGKTERVFGTSIVDRFLEHARVYLFHNGGEDRLFIASADLMTRNLDRRIEVACPIEDPDLKQELKHLLALQLADTKKARVIDAAQSNRIQQDSGLGIAAQQASYEYLQAPR